MRNQSNGLFQIGGYQIRTDVILGKGATGNVYKGTRTTDRLSVAIKAIDMSNVNNQVTQYLLQGEKKALTEIKHPYVIKCQEIIQNQDYCYIVMQQCPGGTLRDYIKNKGSIPQAQAISLFRKIVHGYCKIIDTMIIHRDLKTANIMLKSNKDPVIIDFGYCQMIMGKRPLIRYNVGSPTYMSPQAYENSRYSQKSDVWALGVILHQMITGKTLDQGTDIKSYFEAIKKYKIPPFNISNCSQLVHKLLESSLTVSPQERASSHRLKYLIDISVGGPLMNPQGPSLKIQHNNTAKASFKTGIVRQQAFRENICTDATVRPFELSRKKNNEGRNSSLNINEGCYYPNNLQYNNSNSYAQHKFVFHDASGHHSKNRSGKTPQISHQRKVYFSKLTHQQPITRQTYHSTQHPYGLQFKRLL